MKKIIYFIPAFVLMVLIFLASNDPASGEKSDFITTAIWDFIKLISGYNVNDSQEISTSFVIRKLAHITEYALLNLSVYFAVYNSFDKNKFKINIIISIIISLIYSISDEFHQSFIAGRVGTYEDVLIDFSGILISFLILKR